MNSYPQIKIEFMDLLDKFINKKSKDKTKGKDINNKERDAFTIENRKKSILRMIDNLESLPEILRTTHDPQVFIFSSTYGEPLIKDDDRDKTTFTLMKDYGNIFMLLKKHHKKFTETSDILENVKKSLKDIVEHYEFKHASSSSSVASSSTSSSSAVARPYEENEENELEGGGRKRGGCGCMIPQTGGYRATKRDKKYLKLYKQGKSIGFTMRSSLKAKGLIPRANGTRKVSNKYRNKK